MLTMKYGRDDELQSDDLVSNRWSTQVTIPMRW
jgi:hypothetical protein